MKNSSAASPQVPERPRFRPAYVYELYMKLYHEKLEIS